MSTKLFKSVGSVSSSVKNVLRQFNVDSVKYRDVIAIKNIYDNEEDVETHTGQKLDKDNIQRVRFLNYTKYVNPNFAVDLIAKVPPIVSKDRVVWCDGGDEHLGHPKVYINLDQPGNHTCGYCGLRFVKDNEHEH